MSESVNQPPKESVKETLVSIIIAFVLAFVFRGFVIEAFVIPTGSMAPTLLGQHMRFQSPESGKVWTVGPWEYADRSREPLSVQGASGSPVVVHDPMTGARGEHWREPLRAGDRILVQKYLYALHEPSRYDVIVFKNPSEPGVNFIKRLIGLPGQQLALVDGDVFVRPAPAGAATGAGLADWSGADWRVAPKPDAVAREVWQPVFDSAYAPTGGARADGTRFASPWVGEGWAIEGQREYTFAGTGATELKWDADAPLIREAPRGSRGGAGRSAYEAVPEPWAFTDRTAYNENPTSLNPPMFPRFPVGDLRLRGVLSSPVGGELEFAAVVSADGHEFRGRVSGGTARVEMRPEGAGETDWVKLAEGAVPAGLGAAGQDVTVEFWHMDQTLALWLDGRVVARGEYRWTPSERVKFATGRSLEEWQAAGTPAALQLGDPRVYKASTAAWQFARGPVTMKRVAVDRDLYYRPDFRRGRNGEPEPSWATHPSLTMTLGPDQFFACGDNSPASEDSRKWGAPDPWAALIDPTPGVVPRELLLGKAFFVYFPALAGDGPIPMPDFGRMRFIR